MNTMSNFFSTLNKTQLIEIRFKDEIIVCDEVREIIADTEKLEKFKKVIFKQIITTESFTLGNQTGISFTLK